MAELDRIAALDDLEAQGRAVADLLSVLDLAHDEAVRMRHEIVIRLRESGCSHAEVATIINVARGRAAQIAAGKHTGRRPKE